MAAILNFAMLYSDTLFYSLRFTQKHSHSTLNLTQTNLIWLKLIHSHSTWWWWPSWILPSWIPPSWIQLLPCWIQTPCFLLSDSLKNTLTPLWLWLKLIQSDSNSFILTQLDDGSHLEFMPSWTKLPPSWIQLLPCWIQTPCFLLSDSLKNTLTPLWLWLKLIQSDSNSFILTQLDDGSHLEFCHLEFHHLGFSHLSFSSQTHSHLPRLVPTICTQKNFTHTSFPKFRIWSSPGASPPPHPTHLPHGGVLGSFPHLASFVGPHYLWLKNHQDIVLTH